MPTTKYKKIDQYFLEASSSVKLSLPKLRRPIHQAATVISTAFKKGNKLLICGNGGSAADAQHFAAELVGRYLTERRALPAIALTTDTSALTAIGNDYGFDKIFTRQLEALAKSGDVLFCISTSGNSVNVVEAARLAKKMRVKVVSLTGNDGGKLKAISDINLTVPSNSTPHIQEIHLATYHTLCDLIESALED